MTNQEKLDRLERFAATVTDLHLHYAEEARRYAQMLDELIELRTEIERAEVTPEVARLIAESVRPTPPAPGSVPIEADADLMARMKPGRARRHRGFGAVSQVG